MSRTCRRIFSCVAVIVCFVFTLQTNAKELGQEDPPNFAEDVAPIIYQNCTSCHRPGQSAPFALTNYSEVQRHAETIEAVTSIRYMPPWKPSHSSISFANDRKLSEEQIDTLRKWVEAKCPSGDLAKAPQAPVYTSQWSLGTPDLVLKMPHAFAIPADGPDIYRSFVLPVNLPEDKWIKAIETRPSTPGVVHHALFFAVDSESLRNIKSNDDQPGMKGMSFLRPGSGFKADGLDRLVGGLGGYVPGAVPNRLPGDLAKHLPSGSDIVMQTHFHPTGKAESEQSEIGIYFATEEPTHKLVQLQLPPLFGAGAGIDIPAGESKYTITDSYTLPIDVMAHEVGGHAHYICSNMKLTAELPSGEVLILFNIEDWDLDWQDQYQFEASVPLPRGTVLKSEIVYDNSSDNPENPNTPPERITWGRESTDEMGSISLQLTAVDESQRSELVNDVRKRTRDSIRKRARSQSGSLQALLGDGNRNGGLLRRMDTNKDGKLQTEEIPQRFRDRILEFMDRDGNGVLEEEELQQARDNFNRLTD